MIFDALSTATGNAKSVFASAEGEQVALYLGDGSKIVKRLYRPGDKSISEGGEETVSAAARYCVCGDSTLEITDERVFIKRESGGLPL